MTFICDTSSTPYPILAYSSVPHSDACRSSPTHSKSNSPSSEGNYFPNIPHMTGNPKSHRYHIFSAPQKPPLFSPFTSQPLRRTTCIPSISNSVSFTTYQPTIIHASSCLAYRHYSVVAAFNVSSGILSLIHIYHTIRGSRTGEPQSRSVIMGVGWANDPQASPLSQAYHALLDGD